jgi:DNA ligase-1
MPKRGEFMPPQMPPQAITCRPAAVGIANASEECEASMLKSFVRVAGEVGATTKKLEKERLLREYLAPLDDATLERAVLLLAGSPFPRKDERVTGVGWATIVAAATEALGIDGDLLVDRAVKEGDLGDGIAPFFPEQSEHDLTVLELAESFDELAATAGSAAKTEILRRLYSRLDREEARLVTKILVGETRIGLQEGLLESALAKTFEQPLASLRRAHMFNGDLGATALLAKGGALETAAMTLFQPIAFMLAQPEETAAGIHAQLGAGAIADDKYDGIRAQIHASNGEVKIYSRTLDEISERFPEVREAARSLTVDCIVDGEIVAFRGGILPFAILQKRIGRRKLSDKLLAEAPVVFFAYDLLLHESPVIDEPLEKRLGLLRALIPDREPLLLAYSSRVSTVDSIDVAFDAARARRNEGLVIKDPLSPYTPGRRGKSWLKYKKALATLDCVVTGAQFGHGKRRNVLSDYTFAIRHEGELLNIGKAYSGLTDAEIDALTEKFKSIATGQYGPFFSVRPEVVLEIAFDRIQESSRHKSGYALRFPRIARIRDDKSVEEISTLDEVRRIYEGQTAREEG